MLVAVSNRMKRLVPPPGAAYALVAMALGAVLLSAAALKAWSLRDGENPLLAPWNSRALPILLVLLELAWGLWLLTGLFARWTRLATLALFALFFEVSLYQVLSAAPTCDCLGAVSASPWFTLVFDAVAISALPVLQPQGN